MTVGSANAKTVGSLSLSEQQMEQLKKTNEWLDGELKRKSTEFNTYRKEKVNFIIKNSSLNNCSNFKFN